MYPPIGQHNKENPLSNQQQHVTHTLSNLINSNPSFNIVIAEPFRVSPPVPGPPSPPEGQAPPSNLIIDFTREEQLLTELANHEEVEDLTGDPYLTQLNDLRLRSTYTEEELAMAHSLALYQNQSKNTVLEIAKGYKELKEMGFNSLHIAGALALHNNDAEAASDCLADLQ